MQRWSPRQISNRLRTDFPGQPEMHIVPETVYQALYGRGSLDLAVDPAVSLRSGRTGRRPRRRKEHRTRRFPDMVMIRDSPCRSDWQIGTRALGISMFLSSSLSPDSWHWFLVDGVVAEHGPEDVDAASGEGDERLFVGLSFAAFPVVIGS